MILQNRVAIVTGGASGIGRAVALAYAREGAQVVVADLAEDGGAETVSLIASASPATTAMFVRTDTSKPEEHEQLVRATVERFGALHIACNNAGIGGERNPVAEMSLRGWRSVIEVNLSGVFYGMRAQIPRMIEAGGGAIVNISSIYGHTGAENAAAYVAAKHGVIGLTKTAALEYASRGVRVNTVSPAYIDTPLLNRLPAERLSSIGSLHPLGRLGRAEEVAEAVLWLSSERAGFVTGTDYAVDGGFLAR